MRSALLSVIFLSLSKSWLYLEPKSAQSVTGETVIDSRLDLFLADAVVLVLFAPKALLMLSTAALASLAVLAFSVALAWAALARLMISMA